MNDLGWVLPALPLFHGMAMPKQATFCSTKAKMGTIFINIYTSTALHGSPRELCICPHMLKTMTAESFTENAQTSCCNQWWCPLAKA